MTDMQKYEPSFRILEGDLFPEVSLKDQHGRMVKLSELKNKFVVFYFYPQDDTPTCTKEACNIRDNFASLKRRGIKIFGISPDSEKSHLKFIEKHQLNFDLLIDDGHQLADQLGIWGLKFTFGREYEGLHRVTYVIGQDRRIVKIIYPVESGIHAQQIIDAVHAR